MRRLGEGVGEPKNQDIHTHMPTTKKTTSPKRKTTEEPPVAAPAPAPAPEPAAAPAPAPAPEPAADPAPAPAPEPAAEPAPKAKRGSKKKAAPLPESEAEAAPPPAKRKKKETKKPRAKSAYSFFAGEYRGTLEPNLPFSEVSKLCGEAWKGVEDKSKWTQMAEESNQAMRDALPPAPPKRPVSGYIAFSVAKRRELKEANPEMTFKGLSGECAKLWKALTKEEQAAWKPTTADGAESVVSMAE